VKYWGSNLTDGVAMPHYLSQHKLACLTRQGAETLAQLGAVFSRKRRFELQLVNHFLELIVGPVPLRFSVANLLP